MENLYTRISTVKTNIRIFSMEIDMHMEGDANKITKKKIKNIKVKIDELSSELIDLYSQLNQKEKAIEWLNDQT